MVSSGLTRQEQNNLSLPFSSAQMIYFLSQISNAGFLIFPRQPCKLWQYQVKHQQETEKRHWISGKPRQTLGEGRQASISIYITTISLASWGRRRWKPKQPFIYWQKKAICFSYSSAFFFWHRLMSSRKARFSWSV